MEKEWIPLIGALSGATLAGLLALGLKWLELGRTRRDERQLIIRNRLETLHELILVHVTEVHKLSEVVAKFQDAAADQDNYQELIRTIRDFGTESYNPQLMSLQAIYADDLQDANMKAMGAIREMSKEIPKVLAERNFGDIYGKLVNAMDAGAGFAIAVEQKIRKI
jgi:hypothetical protein